MKKYLIFSIIFIIFLISKYDSISQMITWGDEELKFTEFRNDWQSNPDKYLGDYHFGFSESESILILSKRGKNTIVTLEYSDFDLKKETFISRKKVFNKIKIIGNILVGDGFYGLFVFWNSLKNERSNGLILFHSPVNFIKNEFGNKFKH